MKEVLFNKLQRLKKEAKHLVDNKPMLLRTFINPSNPIHPINSGNSINGSTAVPQYCKYNCYALCALLYACS
jgi:hypothetical protein